jgi:hypothetical protein
MNLERTSRQARLAAALEGLSRAELEAEALLTELRLCTDPLLHERLTDMDMDKAASIMDSLAARQREARRLRDRVRRLREALGD